jgi:hypothetical protein
MWGYSCLFDITCENPAVICRLQKWHFKIRFNKRRNVLSSSRRPDSSTQWLKLVIPDGFER